MRIETAAVHARLVPVLVLIGVADAVHAGGLGVQVYVRIETVAGRAIGVFYTIRAIGAAWAERWRHHRKFAAAVYRHLVAILDAIVTTEACLIMTTSLTVRISETGAARWVGVWIV